MKFKTILYSFFVLVFISCNKQTINADILIKNGTVYTGIDSLSSAVSIAIKADSIVFVGTEDKVKIRANKTIDASGYIVSPGFIDPHTHADRDLIKPEDSHNLPFLMQGITTVVVGNDGESFFPSAKYRELYMKQGVGTNVVMLAGHGTIRNQVMGPSDRKPTADEIMEMQNIIQREMDAGAFGMSTGLFYAPGSYSNTDEVIALAKVVAQKGGIYDTHLRDESSYTVGLITAIEEAVNIGRKAGLPIHISHIKCLGTDVWRQSDSIVKLIEKAQKEGVKITANQYPYDASATGLKSAVIPRWAESGGIDSLFIRMKYPVKKLKILKETTNNIARRGGPDKLLIVKSDEQEYVGKNLEEISIKLGVTPAEAAFKVLEAGYARVASFNMYLDDIQTFMKQPWVVTGSDGNTGHPRKYGSFPRKYSKYVIDKKIMSLGRFINGSSSKTAEIFKIAKRGKIAKGYYADIIIFDPDIFTDVAYYNDAFQLSEGLRYSIINGEIVVEEGEFTNRLNGKVLTK